MCQSGPCAQPASTERRGEGDGGILLQNDKISEFLNDVFFDKAPAGFYGIQKWGAEQFVGDRELLKRVKEFQPKETKFTQKTQSAHFSHNRGCFIGDEARGGRGRGWDGEVDRLIRA
jgi:hypothetical protein